MRKTFAERADDSVRWTGVPTLVEGLHTGREAHRRRLRFWPIVALALAVVGTVLMLTGGRPQLLGPSLYVAGFFVATFLPIFGPVKPWGALKADEYDRQLRRSALLFAYVGCTVFAMTAFILISYWQLAGWDRRQIGTALSLSIGWLMILQGALPTLWASWATQPLPEEP